MLFSIESTTNFYNVFNLWKSFYVATIAVIIFKSFKLLGFVQLFDASGHHFYRSGLNIGLNQELPFFILLAIFMGLIGPFYIFIHRIYCKMKRDYNDIWFFNPWFYTILIAGIITNAEYFSKVTQFPDKDVIKSFVDIDWTLNNQNRTIATDENAQDYSHWDYDEMSDITKWQFQEHYMLLYIFEKLIFTFLTLSCPVPGGIFMPIFAIGAVSGQLYCSLLLRILGTMGHQDLILFRGVYSIIGAGALTASVTRTVSVAVIVLELNGHLTYVVPVLVSVLISYILSELIKPQGFYEMIFELRGFTKLVSQKGKIMVREILEVEDRFSKIKYLTLEMAPEEIYLTIY